MGIVMRNILLCLMLGAGCSIYYETIGPVRVWRTAWVKYTAVPAFALGFLVIAFTEIPPYILQPVRVIAVLWLVSWIYFQMKAVQSLILSVLFCAAMWIVTAIVVSAVYALPPGYRGLEMIEEELSYSVLLCLMLVFHFRYRKKISGLTGAQWARFGYFPIFSMIVIMAISMMMGSGDTERLVAVAGFGVLNVIALYFIGNILEKDAQVQEMRLLQECTQNQMEMYQNMQKNYERQRRDLHDYKNQLTCIQGLLLEDRREEALHYVETLNGNLRKDADFVNTNHAVVNVVLNQKYQSALERNITMLLSVNDLSGLTMREEDLVTLLVNLLDNAVEACEKLEENRVIRFKMVLEEGELILSVRNPVAVPVIIDGKRIVTTKNDGGKHGIGLLNVNGVIERSGGTSALRCEDGWFCFSAMIPAAE